MQKLLFLICISCFFKAEAQKPSALAIADSLYAVGNYTEAIKAYGAIAPKNESVYLQIAHAQQAKGTLGDALSSFKKAASSPAQTVALNDYGKLLITTGHYREADSVFSLLITTYKNNPNFYYQRGRARKEFPSEKTVQDSVKSDIIKAKATYVSDFKQAVKLDSSHQKALYETALFCLKQKNFPVVERLCKKALEQYPENVKMISLLAQNNFTRGFLTDATPLFEKLIELGQNSQFIHERLGMCYYKRNHFEKAIDQYLLALAQDPEDFSIHASLAKLYNFTEDFKNAEKHGKLALHFKDLPLDVDYFTLATTYRLHKKWGKAMRNFNQCLVENTDHKKALYYKAVTADNYYEDERSVLDLYERFIEKYEEEEYASYDPLLKLAQDRRDMLTQEIFMAAEKE